MYKNFTRRPYFKKILNAIFTKKFPIIERAITSSPVEDIRIPTMSLPEFIFQSFDKFPNETAVECSVTGKKYTFDEIRGKSRNFGWNLRKKLNLKKRDVVAILLPNVPDYPICFLGAIQAGLIVTTISTLCTPEEIRYHLSESNAKAIITLGVTYSTAKAARKLYNCKIPILTIKMRQDEVNRLGAIDASEFYESVPQTKDNSRTNPSDTIFMPFSSGTTGLPKAVELTHHSIIANICQINSDPFNFLPERTENHVNVVPAILPWFHIYGNVLGLLQQLVNFSKIISVPKFTLEGFVKMLAQHKPNILYLVPPTISLISTHPVVTSELLDSLTTIMSGAAPLGKYDEEKLVAKLGRNVTVYQGYGSTEMSPTVSMTTHQSVAKFGYKGSSGFLLPNTSLKLLSTEDLTSEILESNKNGEVLLKGPQAMKGYLNRPIETAQAFLDGWYRTGDLGYIDENGLLYITGRLKELIKVKGYQVAPAELEAVLRSHKDVSDAAVVGVFDNKNGEIPLAYVVPKLNARVNVTDLYNYVAKKVAEYKHLKGGVILVNSLPKTASGKLMRKRLRNGLFN